MVIIAIFNYGHVLADDNVSRQLGNGLEAYAAKDYRTAWEILYPLANGGQVEAQRKIGVMLRHGLGVKKDDAKAIYWYRKAAENGHVRAQNSLGVMYRFGMGVKRDAEQAAHWIMAAAKQGDAKARENLGLMYMEGDGLEQSDKQAVYWLKQAAFQGQAKSQLTLGLLTLAGRGAVRDVAGGMQWIQRAAESGSRHAAQALARAYSEGLYGLSVDLDKAQYWSQRAGLSGANRFQAN